MSIRDKRYIWFILDQNGSEDYKRLYSDLVKAKLISFWKYLNNDDENQTTYYVITETKENFLKVKRVLTGKGIAEYGVASSGELVNGSLCEWSRKFATVKVKLETLKKRYGLGIRTNP